MCWSGTVVGLEVRCVLVRYGCRTGNELCWPGTFVELEVNCVCVRYCCRTRDELCVGQVLS